jgi:hypothetical protein
MIVTTLHPTDAVRRTWADFIAEATEAAESARARAEVALLLAGRTDEDSFDTMDAWRERRRLRREAHTYDREARRLDEAVWAIRNLLGDYLDSHPDSGDLR